MYRNRNRRLLNCSSLELPVDEDFANTITHLRDSATGIDGVPYSAYKANVELSASVFSNHTRYFSRCVQPEGLSDFNMQVVWFAPKGVQDGDKYAVYREPSQLRTIFGSNTDSKIVSSALAFKLTPPTLVLTPACQRGFCRGRQLSLNTVDLDSYMRAYNSMCNFSDVQRDISNIPCTALYDFCNAFPTMLHEWLFLVLRALEVPESYRWVVWWLYTSITAFSSGAGDGSFLFNVLAGVKTGCPLSSIAFLLGINPIVDLFLFLSDGPKLSATRVCADDFGSALKCLHWIKIHASIFRLAARTTGLCLKPSKCILIISGCELTEFLKDAIRNWITVHAPEFSTFSIVTSGKYLGWVLGRNSIQLSYAAPLDKYQARVQEIVEGRAVDCEV